jgi:hypothetical protein
MASETDPLGIRGIAFGPNLGSPDFLELFRRPETWSELRRRLTAFKFYQGNILNEGDGLGANTYEALRDVGAFRMLSEWRLPLHLEHAAIKPWEKERKGEILREKVRDALSRVRDAGGAIGIVSMDEPLATSVTPSTPTAHEIEQGWWGPERVGDLARLTANFVSTVRDAGATAALIEGYPRHPVDRIDGFLNAVFVANGASLAFLELDLDLWDIRNQKLSGERVRDDLSRLRNTCARHGAAFRVIATGTHATSPATYRSETMDVARLVRRLAAPVDGVTVQSWLEHDHRTIPANLPNTDPTAHVRIVADVLSMNLTVAPGAATRISDSLYDATSWFRRTGKG